MPNTCDFHTLGFSFESTHNSAWFANDLSHTGIVKLWDDAAGLGEIGQMHYAFDEVLDESSGGLGM